ncbi:DUF2273 domain-containing protein [Corynebacterium aquilae]|uniref:DUF2273 domain-containing protein n=1 Tax=Corynebacterium aquilae DSM 44791 TaxID=1431546 RepID=A0A1L7CDQ6_9CORY|nr:hypothetical protein CAQU_01735 [Corynebacterium aquilae DSM 44791]
MNTTNTTLGVLAGSILAFATLMFGLYGFIVVVLFAAIGGVIGAHFDGRLDLGQVLSNLGRSGRG